MIPIPQQDNKPYYYSVTGDVLEGVNTEEEQYTSALDGRFPMGTDSSIYIQSEGWMTDNKEEPSPLYQTPPGVIRGDFAEGKSTPVAENA